MMSPATVGKRSNLCQLRFVLLIVLCQRIEVLGLSHRGRGDFVDTGDPDVWQQQQQQWSSVGNDRNPIVPKVEHTRSGNSTAATLTYNLPEEEAAGGTRTVQVELRESPFQPQRTFLERQGQHHHGTGDETILEYFDENCHYQGWVIGRSGSSAAISTCDGRIRGTVFDLDETYYIDFDEATGEQFVERLSDFSTKEMPPSRVRRNLAEDSGLIGPYNANSHSRYVELVLVVDNSLYRKFGSDVWEVHRYCTDIVNHVNMLFAQLNIFVALTGVVVWDQHDHIQVTHRADDTLSNFLQYRRKELLRQHPNDHAQLLTAVKFQDNVVGKARLGGMCTSNSSGAVIVVHTENIAIQAGTLAHEMGHSFNMEHDEDSDCDCPDRKCIMTATVSGPSLQHWSSCSVTQLALAFRRGLNHCLKDLPGRLHSSSCGNGFVEHGEECDCGLPEVCDNPCCDAKLCRLKDGATCATGSCCDLASCQLKEAGVVCRSVHTECDLPEYCTGRSEHCPRDVFRRTTEPCANGEAYCSEGECRTRNDQCRLLWGPSGVASDVKCYAANVNGTKYGNCGYDRDGHSFRKCAPPDVQCGLLFCDKLGDNRIEFGVLAFVEERIALVTNGLKVKNCHSAFIDLGDFRRQSMLVPDGSPCGPNLMCYQQQCWDVNNLNDRGIGKQCQKPDCSGHGVCNSEGNCHCDVGYAPPFCEYSGLGGSLDSGPASKGSYLALRITLVIVGVIVTTLFVAYIVIRCCRLPDACHKPLKICNFQPTFSRESRHKLVATVSSNSAVIRDISAPKLCSSTRTDIDGPQFTPIARLKSAAVEAQKLQQHPPQDYKVNSVVSVRSVTQPEVGYRTHVQQASPRRLPRPPVPPSSPRGPYRNSGKFVS